MSNEKGMSMLLKVFIGLFVSGILVVVIAATSVMGINNDCVKQEAGIKAQYKQNQNNYDNMFKKFMEATQVTSMYTDDLKKVYDSAIQGRYAKSGNVMMNFIKEHNPSFDASMYKNLQVMIESGRNTFESNQKMLLDKKRNYEVQIGSFPAVFVVRVLGFPKIDLAKYDIVTSGQTQEAFDTKKAKAIKLR